MSLAKVNSMGLMGLDGYLVEVQIDLSNGMPSYEIVGLPNAAVREAKERVRAAIKNIGAAFPTKRIIVNLAPANYKKEGVVYDLPIAVALLCATAQIAESEMQDTVFLGELSLDGKLNPVSGVLPMTIAAYQHGVKNIFVPSENASEAAVVEGINVYAAESLTDVVNHFNDIKKIEPFKKDYSAMFENTSDALLDFCDVKGQENAKRALEIAAAGNHNVLMIGSPGTGKTMLAQRISSILPDLTFDEALEISKIHSIAGTLPGDCPLVTKRPFRSPHHTISSVGLSGGGTIPKPGELSLAHNGVLFLDELPEFKRDVLEVMRQPLEDGKVTISRVNATLTYPCNFMLVASMNPCKCGYLGDPKRQCTCTPAEIVRYRNRISGPLLDRIDIQVEVGNVDYEKLSSEESSEKSSEIKKRVNRAREIQLERYKNYNIYSNSQLTPALMQEFCRLGEKENETLKSAFERLGLSARAHSRILKVARTIADMDEEKDISVIHLFEAIQYRDLDRKYFE